MNYRSITLMDTAYKIYASILNERMKYVVEMKLKEDNLNSDKEESQWMQFT